MTELLYNDSGGNISAMHLDNGIQTAEPRLTITVDELAKQLNISRATAYNLSRKKEFFPAFRIGNRTIISVQALRRWLDEQTGG